MIVQYENYFLTILETHKDKKITFWRSRKLAIDQPGKVLLLFILSTVLSIEPHANAECTKWIHRISVCVIFIIAYTSHCHCLWKTLPFDRRWSQYTTISRNVTKKRKARFNRRGPTCPHGRPRGVSWVPWSKFWPAGGCLWHAACWAWFRSPVHAAGEEFIGTNLFPHHMRTPAPSLVISKGSVYVNVYHGMYKHESWLLLGC